MFIQLRLPPPSNISRNLAILADQGFVMQPGHGQWATTPTGKERLRILMAGVDDEQLQRLVDQTEEAEFSNTRHHLLPPQLAPAAFQVGIGRFLEGHPFDRNVLCMSRFPRTRGDPIHDAIAVSRSTCAEAGFEMHLASDRVVEDLLFGNVAAAMWASRFGIAVFEDRVGEGLNYNVILEVGAMLATGRRCLLLKDVTIGTLPTDLVGHIYQSIDLDDPATIATAVARWITQDLGLGG
ncbi:MAG: hypothetical protein JSU97_08900 [Dehalococcoidia bacterium]|nr:MAG: hypothetical protein JSU97_08900 [Dehalococcoidia bacterium]